MFKQPALHSDDTLTAFTIRTGPIRALTTKPLMRPTSISCRQSRWQPNKRSHPLIRIHKNVQTNRATSGHQFTAVGCLKKEPWEFAHVH